MILVTLPPRSVILVFPVALRKKVKMFHRSPIAKNGARTMIATKDLRPTNSFKRAYASIVLLNIFYIGSVISVWMGTALFFFRV